MSSKAPAFTLLELIIVMFLIGLLTTLGFSSYENIILKSHRMDAKTSLLDYQVRLQHCFIEQRNYQHCAEILELLTPQPSAHHFYDIILSHFTETEYSLSATAKNAQKKDEVCYQFTLDQQQQRNAYTHSGELNTQCW